jgi:hypothetical protein
MSVKLGPRVGKKQTYTLSLRTYLQSKPPKSPTDKFPEHTTPKLTKINPVTIFFPENELSSLKLKIRKQQNEIYSYTSS